MQPLGRGRLQTIRTIKMSNVCSEPQLVSQTSTDTNITHKTEKKENKCLTPYHCTFYAPSPTDRQMFALVKYGWSYAQLANAESRTCTPPKHTREHKFASMHFECKIFIAFLKQFAVVAFSLTKTAQLGTHDATKRTTITSMATTRIWSVWCQLSVP